MTAVGKKRIALALSGGGVRAMAFHLGVLRAMAEKGLLENVQLISTVSGGSLITGLIFRENGYAWPNSDRFLNAIYPALKALLISRSIARSTVWQLLNPSNWQFLLSRSNLLALALKKEWGIDIPLSELPDSPEWSINATTAENGKRFRFKKGSLGDYQLGYAEPGSYPLANAMAVSAAFPGGLGALALKTTDFNWKYREWGRPAIEAAEIQLPYDTLHLYDGGVYDNLGLEPFFDQGTQKSKVGDVFILVSDAGKPLELGFSYFKLNPIRFKRVADIMGDQSHGLRLRGFWSYIKTDQTRGAVVNIIDPVDEVPCASAKYASAFPTSLNRMHDAEFEGVSSHGYKVALKKLFETLL